MLIAFSGVDCSGKSTHIRALAQWCVERGLPRPQVLWYRPGYSRMLDLVRGGIRKIRNDALPPPRDERTRQVVFGKRWVRRAWISAALLDSILHYAVIVRAKSAFGATVLCDRFVEDALLDLRLRFPQDRTEALWLARILRTVAPAPDVRVMLTISDYTMTERLKSKCEPFPDTPEVRAQRLAAYREIAQTYPGAAVDAEAAFETVSDEIRRRIIAARVRGGRCASAR